MVANVYFQIGLFYPVERGWCQPFLSIWDLFALFAGGKGGRKLVQEIVKSVEMVIPSQQAHLGFVYTYRGDLVFSASELRTPEDCSLTPCVREERAAVVSWIFFCYASTAEAFVLTFHFCGAFPVHLCVNLT